MDAHITKWSTPFIKMIAISSSISPIFKTSIGFNECILLKGHIPQDSIFDGRRDQAIVISTSEPSPRQHASLLMFHFLGVKRRT
jgi:hypothetical protein